MVWIIHPASPPTPPSGLLLQCPVRMQGPLCTCTGQHLQHLKPCWALSSMRTGAKSSEVTSSTSPGCPYPSPQQLLSLQFGQPGSPAQERGTRGSGCIPCPSKATSPSSHLQGTPWRRRKRRRKREKRGKSRRWGRGTPG